jgi:hypothetical protein
MRGPPWLLDVCALSADARLQAIRCRRWRIWTDLARHLFPRVLPHRAGAATHSLTRSIAASPAARSPQAARAALPDAADAREAAPFGSEAAAVRGQRTRPVVRPGASELAGRPVLAPASGVMQESSAAPRARPQRAPSRRRGWRARVPGSTRPAAWAVRCRARSRTRPPRERLLLDSGPDTTKPTPHLTSRPIS